MSGRDRDVAGRDRDVGGRDRDVGGRDCDMGGRDRDVGGRDRDVSGRVRDVGGRDRDMTGRDRDMGGQVDRNRPSLLCLRNCMQYRCSTSTICIKDVDSDPVGSGSSRILNFYPGQIQF